MNRGFTAGDRILGMAADSHPDWCLAYGELGAYCFIGASAIGKLHLHENRPRDDAFAIRSLGGWLAVAVSDGVGSRPYSRYGSSFAVEALCEYMLREVRGDAGALPEEGEPVRNVDLIGEIKPEFEILPVSPVSGSMTKAYATLMWYRESPSYSSSEPQEKRMDDDLDLSECMRRAFQQARMGMEQFASSRGIRLRDLHCTLLGLLLNTETGAAAAGHIGDGLIAGLYLKKGGQPLVEAPVPGEVGETYVLTQDEWERYLAVRSLPCEETKDITTFYLMTDGVADDCVYPPPEDIFQRWTRDIDREMRREEPLSQTAIRLLNWLATYERKGSWDDRTLVVVVR